MLIAIDHGNYVIKTPHHSFVSGLSEHTVKPPMSDEILEYDGRYWTTSGKRLSYMRDKTQDDRYFILTLSPLQRSLGIPVVTAPWSGKDEQLRLFILFVLATNGNPRQSGGKK